MGVRVSVGPEGSLDFFGLADQQRPESKFHSSVFEWVEDRGLYLSQKEIFSCPSSPIFNCFVLEILVFQLMLLETIIFQWVIMVYFCSSYSLEGLEILFFSIDVTETIIFS